MDRAQLLWLLSLTVAALAFFLPFTVIRARRVELKPVTISILAVAAAVIILYAVGKAAEVDGDSLALLFAAGFLPLGLAAGSRDGWRFVAPVGGVLGLTVLALMVWGPLHPILGTPKFPEPSPITPLTWTILFIGTLLLFVPRRRAVASGTVLLWLALALAALHDAETSELLRVYYMGAPAFFALAALLSAGVPMRKEPVLRPHGIESLG